MSRAEIALAWLHAKAAVAAPIIGVAKSRHITDAVAALELSLSAEEIERLERHYVPHPVLFGGARQTDGFELTLKA